MSVSPNGHDEGRGSSPKSMGILVTLTFLDTTWRLFIPSIGLTLAGVELDERFGTTPWLMIGGIVAGSAIAFWLVRQQLKTVTEDKRTKK